ncbi:MAG: LLM class F420-dependent oxidoreductase, partial [Thermomicrobiales bacterium]
MKFGAIFPQMEIALNREEIRSWTLGVEDLGFDYVLLYDHILGVDPAGRPGWSGVTHETIFH